MGYRENVDALAALWKISNDPALQEGDIRIAEIKFRMPDGQLLSVVGTELNRAGRLFVQTYASSPDGKKRHDQFPCTPEFRSEAEKFFDLRYALIDPSDTKAQLLLRGIHFAEIVYIVWKK